jgi:hypothetical protein
MKLGTLLLHAVSMSLLIVCACLVAGQGDDKVKLRLRLVDADSGKPLAGIVREATDGKARPRELGGLFPRGRGLQLAPEYDGWHVVPAAGADIELLPKAIRLEALSGLETARVQLDLDLARNAPAEAVFKLDPVFRPQDHGVVAGNTHLHLMKLSRQEADEYLKQIPAADGLRVLFLSYLERYKDDLTYITNEYPIGPLPQFDATGVLFNNGEEHRHNFKSHGEGYGHVMFLNLRELVRPVSLGPGITGRGNDDQPLRGGIDAARQQGATVIWCHNTFGFEDVPSVLTGRLDAMNMFDGSRRGSYEDNYYRYLNLGLRLPLSAGTDWFVYDFARVYARLDGTLTIPAWLDALKAGRCQATNGPLLTLKIDGREPGATLALSEPRTMKIEAAAVGRHDFEALQLVHNGKVIRQVAAGRAGPGPSATKAFRAQLTHEARIDAPGWFALRIDSATKNELGQQLYAHTSPVYVDCQGRGVFDVDAALTLLRQVEEAQAGIRAQGVFSSDAAQRRILDLYDAAAQDLRGRINRRK